MGEASRRNFEDGQKLTVRTLRPVATLRHNSPTKQLAVSQLADWSTGWYGYSNTGQPITVPETTPK